MKIQGGARSVRLISGAVLALGIAMVLNRNSELSASSTVLIRPPENLLKLSFGYNDVVADSLWLRVIQNFDACGRNGIAETYDYSKGVDLNNIPICNHSWVYHMVNAVTDLSPKFYTPYYYGGMNLSYLVRDIEGAKDIYDKGLKQYPINMPLLFSAAYHYLQEVKDEKSAAALLIKAAKAGAPSHVMDLAARLYSKDGRRLYAQKQLSNFVENLPEDDAFRIRLQERLKIINEEVNQDKKMAERAAAKLKKKAQ